MTTSTDMGMMHFIGQGDMISKALFAILILLSIASWSVIALRLVNQWRETHSAKLFLKQFWDAKTIAEVVSHTPTPHNAYARLMLASVQAKAHHDRATEHRLAESGDDEAYLTRALRHHLDEEATKQENGMTLLATVAATAPFIGLFGTVWGVYHALLSIGKTGASTIDKIAAPVGEALVMTGLGLAVAIPAVVAYNIFVRRNRLLTTRLETFAFELMTFMAHGFKRK